MNNNSSSNKLPLPLPLVSLNHVSLVCRSLESSLAFYRNVLGFVPIRRPGSFGFDGAWYAQRPFDLDFDRIMHYECLANLTHGSID